MKRLQELEQYVQDKNLPDKEVELFWYGWKVAVENSLKKINPISKSFSYQVELEKTSKLLNDYQQNSEFNNIIYTIQKSIIKHLFICIENNIDQYHTRILLSQLKRWKKIKFSMPELVNIEDSPSQFIIFELYLLISKDSKLEHIVKQEMIDYLIFEDIKKLLILTINNKRASIMDKIAEIYNVYEYINDTYKTNFYPKTKASKILKMISNKI